MYCMKQLCFMSLICLVFKAVINCSTDVYVFYIVVFIVVFHE